MLWNDWVVIDTSFTLSSGMIRLPLSSSYKSHQAKEIAVVDASKAGLWALRDLLTANDPQIPVALSIFTNHSSEYWSMLIGQCNVFKSISILPLQHSDQPPVSSTSLLTISTPPSCSLDSDKSAPSYQMSDYHPPAVDPSSMCTLFERMHSDLELFTFPLLSLHKLINTSITFPKVHTLNVGLSAFSASLSGEDGQAHLIDWSKVKHTFPNLQDLTLHPLSQTDMKEFWRTIRSLWAAQNLFPWLHSMTIQTSDSSSCLTYPMDEIDPLSSASLANHLVLNGAIPHPPNNITKDEIIATLSRLKDLTRINTGSWDIVAVDQL